MSSIRPRLLNHKTNPVASIAGGLTLVLHGVCAQRITPAFFIAARAPD
jgi:hypothetical protein